MDRTPEQRLADLGLTLPPAPSPAASYLPWSRAGHLLMLAGQVPLVDGRLTVTGRLGEDLDVAAGQQQARACTLNAVAVLVAATGDLSRVAQIVRVTVFVAAAPGFTEAHLVADGASDLLVEVFGEAGRHARSAVGVATLPLGAAVEVEVTARVG